MKKRLLLLECFFIILTLITITKTYGLFETNSQATSNIPIAKWVIKVDGKDLTLAKELNYSDFIITNNNHNDDGYFAPGTDHPQILPRPGSRTLKAEVCLHF